MTTAYLLDTNVVSELVKPSPSPKVTAWLADIATTPCLSVISLSEIAFGIEAAPEKRRPALGVWFDRLRSEAEFLHVTEDIALLAGHLRAESQRNGVALTLADSLIAATAAAARRTLATRNVKDFSGCSVLVFDPFA